MSFDLFIWHATTRVTPEEAQSLHEHLSEGEPTPAAESEQIAAFLEQLSEKFPSLDDCAEEDVEDCPWAGGFERGDRHAFLTIRWSHAAEMAPIVVELALDHGLSCLDPQDGRVYQPSALPIAQ